MNEFLLYAGALLSGGAIICAVTFVLAALVPAARHWSGLWATALLVSASIPVAGAALNLFSINLAIPSAFATSPDTFKTVFDPSLFDGPGEGAVMATHALVDRHGATVLASIYFTVLAMLLIRLVTGRRRARLLACRAQGPFAREGINYWVSPDAHAPFAVSAWRADTEPRIIIPTRFIGQLSDTSLTLILKHEQAHIRRKDDQLGVVLRVVRALCWFSPFTHLLFARWSQSAEVQCDAAALANHTTEMRRVYAKTLLEALHIMAGRVRQYPAASFSTHRIWSEKMRIKEIMKGSPAVFKRRTGSLLLACLALPATTIGALSVAAHGKGSDATASAAMATQPVAQVKIVEGKVTARFGTRPDPFSNGEPKMHHGIDIAAPIGTPIKAPADGVIVEATKLFDNKPAYGIVVVHLSRDGTQTLFSHLDDFSVITGETVTAGQPIATVGNSGRSTGPHVHIETTRNGERVDPQSVWPMLQ